MKMTHLYATVLALFACFTFTHQTFATTATNTPNQAEVEKRVREYFADTPVMIEIARCESKFRQFTDAGNPLRSAGMIGVFQFYETIHAPGAKALGYDLTTLDGNLGYAKHVYRSEGTTPWNGSKYCWDVPLATPAKLTSADRDKLLEQIATLTKLIALLQKQLEAKKALAMK